MAGRSRNLVFPMGGLNRKYAYQSQPPYTTPDCLNVRPTGVIEKRARGGSRPGHGKAYYELLGAGTPVRMANSLLLIADTLNLFTDNFDGDALSADWAVAGWGNNLLPLVWDGSAAIQAASPVGAVCTAISINATASYLVEMLLEPWGDRFYGRYKLWVRMDASSPDVTNNGIEIELALVTDDAGLTTYDGYLRCYVAGTPTVYGMVSGGAQDTGQPGWLSVKCAADNTVTVLWKGTALFDAIPIGAASLTGTRAGFGFEVTETGGWCGADQFRVQYVDLPTPRRMLVASAGGSLYREVYADQLSAVSTSLTLASDRYVASQERLQKLYIADHAKNRVSGTDGTIAADGVTLDAASVTVAAIFDRYAG